MKEGGAHAVKLEGGEAIAATIERIVAAEIPVMAHVGLTPQAIHRMGGHRVQGRDEASRTRVIRDAQAVEAAGAFSVVLEGVPADLALEITQLLTIPTIGIGASAQCDGQVLVTEDMLGMFERVPRFVKKYEDIAALIERTAASYAEDVRNRSFPGEDQTYQPKS